MKIYARLFSTLKRFAPNPGGPGGEFILELEAAAEVGALFRRLKIPDDVQRVVLVNGRHATAATRLVEGDRVVFFPPMTGG
jgi:molybdopterin converting factor small subunit